MEPGEAVYTRGRFFTHTRGQWRILVYVSSGGGGEGREGTRSRTHIHLCTHVHTLTHTGGSDMKGSGRAGFYCGVTYKAARQC